MKVSVLAIAVLGLLTLGLATASAQDVYKVNYFDNNVGSLE
jgi:hypothetical protein